MWRDKLQQVDVLAHALEALDERCVSDCDHLDAQDAVDDSCDTAPSSLGVALQRLVAFLDDDDPLVAFAAMRHLEQMHQRMLSQQSCAAAAAHAQRIAQMVQLLLLTGSHNPPSRTHWSASSGFRFQFLRLLVQSHSTTSTDTSDSSSDDESESESTASRSSDNDANAATSLCTRPGLAAVLHHTPLLTSIAHSVLQAPAAATDSTQSSVSYELLRFLTAVVDEQLTVAQSDKLEATSLMQRAGFDAFATDLLELFASAIDYAAQPTYVSCAAVALLHRLLQLHRMTQRTCDWLRLYMRVVTPVHSNAALTSVALALLASHAHESSATAAQVAFVSSRSAFPFLQTWLAFMSTFALTLVEHQRCCQALYESLALAFAASTDSFVPDRAVLLAVLSEQDDVMVDVLNTLLQLSIFIESSADKNSVSSGYVASDSKAHSSVAIQKNKLAQYVREQLDPDLLFADILETLGNDHLVLLDLLISSETGMLEYLLRYLRRLETNWTASCAMLSLPSVHNETQQQQSRLDDVLAVLIRLRFEIDKQVASEMFPYNPTPLLRRLERIEALYEAMGDASQYTD